MKTLMLMRHAKSSWDNPALVDHDRPLNARGRRDAPRIGAWLRRQQLVPDYLTCSTAARAEQTAREVVGPSGCAAPLEPVLRAELYHASPRAWRSVIRSLPAESRRPLLIGHNPGLEELLHELTGEAVAMPTAAVAVLQLKVEKWSDFPRRLPPGSWSVQRPKQLQDGKGNGPDD